MKIDRKLNLVVPLERHEGTAYVHSIPLGAEIFERYMLVISKAFAAIYREGLGAIAGPRVAYLFLKKTAQDLDVWDGPEGVEAGLMSEIRRLSNALVMTETGWKQVPWQSIVDKKLWSADEIAEVEGLICFFMVVSLMHRQKELAQVLKSFCAIWDLQTTASSATEYRSSLPTPTPADSTGETVVQLSQSS